MLSSGHPVIFLQWKTVSAWSCSATSGSRKATAGCSKQCTIVARICAAQVARNRCSQRSLRILQVLSQKGHRCLSKMFFSPHLWLGGPHTDMERHIPAWLSTSESSSSKLWGHGGRFRSSCCTSRWCAEWGDLNTSGPCRYHKTPLGYGSKWVYPPPNLLGGLKDLPHPGLIGYFLQVLNRTSNEALEKHKTSSINGHSGTTYIWRSKRSRIGL